jgi:hypothetical protein
MICYANKSAHPESSIIFIMSVAGVDPTINIGAPGNATNVAFVEPVIESSETKTEQRKEISHTGINLGLDVISKQFVYTGTYTWSTTDQPGKVLHVFPIHPESCNKYTDHVYQMFNVWTGGQKARVRIIGTAFYGGGLYFVRIPPNYTIEQVNAMDLSSYTAFPHADMDPKNLSSIDLDLPDYRIGHFHQGPLELSNPQSFAGWMAIVVNARLVTQSPEISSIDLRVEMAGDFIYKVPGPIRDVPSEATGPIAAGNLFVPNLTGCDDCIHTINHTNLVVCNAAQKKFHNGAVFQVRGDNGNFNYTFDKASVPTGNSALWRTAIEYARSRYFGDPWQTVQNLVRIFDQATRTMANPITLNAALTWEHRNLRQNNRYGVSVLSETDITWEVVHLIDVDFEAQDGSIHWKFAPGDGPLPKAATFLHQPNPDTAPFDLSQVKPLLTPLEDNPSGESYVAISTNSQSAINSQARAWAQDLRDFKGQWPSGAAALYEGFDQAGVLKLRLKLKADGHMYTTATTASYTSTVETLKFSQWVPENQPITPPPAQVEVAMRAHMGEKIEKEMRKMTRAMAINRRAE